MAPPGHSPELEELLSVYALGALDGGDHQRIEKHLATGCPECRDRLAQLERDLEALLEMVAPVPPSEMTRARLLASLPPAAATGPALPTRRSTVGRGGWGWLAAAAVLLLVCGGGWLTARREAGDLRAERDVLAQKVSGLGRELAAAQVQNERLAQAMAILAAPGMRPIALAGLKEAPGAQGYAFVDPQARKAVFVAAHLPPLASDKTYELWFITDQPVPAGTFAVDARGSGSVQVDRIAPVDQIKVWAVTIEPRGGVPQPTGLMVLKG